MARKNLFVTENGRKIIGKYLHYYRLSLPYEMRLEDLRDKIIKETGYEECSVSSLSKLENGIMRYNSNLVTAMVHVYGIRHPTEPRIYDFYDFHEAACENFSLDTGLPL